MNKFDRLKSISNNAAQQASVDCTAKIEKLTNSQLDEVIKELKNNGANKNEVAELVRVVQAATDKNKALQDFVGKSQNICQAVSTIIGKFVK